jgi:hypothetical protein
MVMALGAILAISPQRRGTTRFDPLQAEDQAPEAENAPVEMPEEVVVA